MSEYMEVMYSGLGYNLSNPSKPPFNYIEGERDVLTQDGALKVIAFGAYNAYGLIGPELGGVAVVHEGKKFIIGDLVLAYNPIARMNKMELTAEAIARSAPGGAARILSTLSAIGFRLRLRPAPTDEKEQDQGNQQTGR